MCWEWQIPCRHFLTCPLSFFPSSWNRIKSSHPHLARTHTIHACGAYAKSAKQFINDAWRRKERIETRSRNAPLVVGRIAEGTRGSGSTPEAPAGSKTTNWLLTPQALLVHRARILWRRPTPGSISRGGCKSNASAGLFANLHTLSALWQTLSQLTLGEELKDD